MIEIVKKRTILMICKEYGFESIESKALEMYVDVFDRWLTKELYVAKSRTTHTRRPTSSLLDIVHQDTPSSSVNLIKIKKDEYKYEVYEPEASTHVDLGSSIDNFIHIYDFMPKFPPFHTFRRTYDKSVTNSNEPSNVKRRLEQSLKCEKNLVRLMRASGKFPGFVNYLYRRNKFD